MGLERRTGTGERGAIVIVVALSLTLLIGFLALVIDLGRLYIAKAELQNAADAAALAAARRLDGTLAGVTKAVDAALSTANQNFFWGNLGEEAVTLARTDVTFSSFPDDVAGGSWQGETSPASEGFFFVRVNTGNRNLNTWFAGVWQIFQTTTSGIAVAGRYPPTNLNPLFVPVVRRNSSQTFGTLCNGNIYDPIKFPSNCPNPPVDKDPVDYRAPDGSENWGFLKPGEQRSFGGVIETGTYYQITPHAYNSLNPWTVSGSWKGNIGFLNPDPKLTQQKNLLDALCRGGSITAYHVPGCGSVNTGNISALQQADSLNTRFDQKSSQSCPSDDNIMDFGSYYNVNGNAPYPPSAYPNGFYSDGYAKPHMSANYKAPTNAPPGVANRRLIRAYVVDNAWLPGYTDGNACTAPLTGSSNGAHLVGCAEFFMITVAGNNGLYAEYAGRIKTVLCAKVGSYADIRLYH